jgi:hypothetical protein
MSNSMIVNRSETSITNPIVGNSDAIVTRTIVTAMLTNITFTILVTLDMLRSVIVTMSTLLLFHFYSILFHAKILIYSRINACSAPNTVSFSHSGHL